MRGSRSTLPVLASAFVFLAGCSGIGTSIDRLPENAAARGFVVLSRPVTLPRSRLTSDCGPESLCAVINYWGKSASVQEISLLVRDENVKGIPTTRVPGLARAKGMKAMALEGSVGRIKNAIDRDIPPIIMVKAGGGNFHFFVVTGYNDREQVIVCEEYDNSKRLIGYEEVEELWKDAGHLMMEIQRSTAEDNFRDGASREAAGKYGEAIALFKKALEADPAHYESLVGLGNCCCYTQKFDDALAAYKRAYEINALDPKVCNNLANVYIELKRDAPEAERLAAAAVDEYQRELQRAQEEIAKEPQASVRAVRQRELKDKVLDLADAYGTLGQAQAFAARHALAIASWQASFDAYPLIEFDSRAKRLYEIALSQRQMGMPADARKNLQRALELVRDPRLRQTIEAALKP
jgi:tetratricopeptide (TPR) repeat protein